MRRATPKDALKETATSTDNTCCIIIKKVRKVSIKCESVDPPEEKANFEVACLRASVRRSRNSAFRRNSSQMRNDV